jgi:hypothetical protein
LENIFQKAMEAKVIEQLKSQRVGYLLGAGSSYLSGSGYPLSYELWDKIKSIISNIEAREDIQEKLDLGAGGIEQALDLLDDGTPVETIHRQLVSDAIAELFCDLEPILDDHVEFLRRVTRRPGSASYIFNLNYDPLIERAAEINRIRISDGFCGNENAFFEPSVFDEHILRIRGTYRGKQYDEISKPIRLVKLHGSLGWYETKDRGICRGHFSLPLPQDSKRLMIPPQHRKAVDTMNFPYSSLWSVFRGALGQDSIPLNRLACFGYGFADEHVNAVIDNALARPDFTVLIFTKKLTDSIWNRWSVKRNVITVTESRCSIKGELGGGHPELWNFHHITKEI